jgi:hypothetical protein
VGAFPVYTPGTRLLIIISKRSRFGRCGNSLVAIERPGWDGTRGKEVGNDVSNCFTTHNLSGMSDRSPPYPDQVQGSLCRCAIGELGGVERESEP